MDSSSESRTIPGEQPGSAAEEPLAWAWLCSALQMFLLFVISPACHTLIFVLSEHSCRACQQECFPHRDAVVCVSDRNFELMALTLET